MKQQIVPTSPKSPHMQEKQEQKEVKANAAAQASSTTHATFFAIIFSIIFGTVAGFLGFAFAWGVPTDWPVIGRLNVISFLESQKTSVLLSGNKNVTSSALDVPQVINQVVPVFITEPVVGSAVAPIADAVVVTSDGWLAVPTSAITNNNEIRTELIVVLSDNSVATVVESIDDAVTNMTLLRIDRDDLSPVVFAQEAEYEAGDTVSVLQSAIGAFSVRELPISSVAGQGSIRNTGTASYRYSIENGEDSIMIGSAAYTANGRLIGMIDHNQLLVPAVFIQAMVEQVQDGAKVIKRSGVQLSYMNIAHITDSEKERLVLPEMGIYIHEVLSTNTDETNTEAQQDNVFLPGDAIISWDGELVEKGDDLALLLHSMTPGETVKVEVQRAGSLVLLEIEI